MRYFAAVSELSDNRVSLARAASSLMNQLKHPYLQAAFAFLCAEKREKHFKAVLACELEMRDKIGFAMRYLDDAELYRFVERRTAAAVRQGDLEGIVLVI